MDKGLLIVIDYTYSKISAKIDQKFNKLLVRQVLQDHSKQSGELVQ